MLTYLKCSKERKKKKKKRKGKQNLANPVQHLGITYMAGYQSSTVIGPLQPSNKPTFIIIGIKKKTTTTTIAI